MQRVQRQEHVQIDIRDDVLFVDRRMRGEISRALQTLLFARHRQENHRALQLHVRFVQHARDLENRRDAGSIIHRAVVNGIAVDRLAHADMIQMRAHHHILVLQLRIGAGQHAGDILRFHLRLLQLHARRDARRQWKMRQRLIVIRIRQNLGDGVA